MNPKIIFNHQPINGEISPNGLKFGSFEYWTELRMAYNNDRDKLRQIVPDGHWIIYKFGWLDKGSPYDTFVNKADMIVNGYAHIIIKPGYESEEPFTIKPVIINY